MKIETKILAGGLSQGVLLFATDGVSFNILSESGRQPARNSAHSPLGGRRAFKNTRESI